MITEQALIEPTLLEISIRRRRRLIPVEFSPSKKIIRPNTDERSLEIYRYAWTIGQLAHERLSLEFYSKDEPHLDEYRLEELDNLVFASLSKWSRIYGSCTPHDPVNYAMIALLIYVAVCCGLGIAYKDYHPTAFWQIIYPFLGLGGIIIVPLIVEASASPLCRFLNSLFVENAYRHHRAELQRLYGKEFWSNDEVLAGVRNYNEDSYLPQIVG